MRYWDASAIVPLPVQEPRTGDAQAALADDAGIVTWWGTRIESPSAIARLERSAAPTSRQASEALELLRTLAAGWNEILLRFEKTVHGLPSQRDGESVS